MTKYCVLGCMLFLACASEPGGGTVVSADDLLSGKTDQTSPLRVRGVSYLEPGLWMRDQILEHSVVSVRVGVSFSGINASVTLPRDFFAQVAGYIVYAEAGSVVEVEIAGPAVQVLEKRVSARPYRLLTDNYFRFTAAESGDYLLMVVPMQIEPRADHISYDIVARIDP